MIPLNFKNDDQLRTYLSNLKAGERVIETGESGLKNRKGTVYISNVCGVCVMWDKLPGETGKMGTGATGGTRRLSDVGVIEVKQGAGIVILHEGRIAVSRRTGTRAFDGYLQIPGGLVEPGETPVAAALRELQEETNWLPRGMFYYGGPQLLGSYDLFYSDGEPYKYYTYVLPATPGNPAPVLENPEPTKSTEWTWMKPRDVLMDKFIPCIEMLLQVDQLSRMLLEWDRER